MSDSTRKAPVDPHDPPVDEETDDSAFDIPSVGTGGLGVTGFPTGEADDPEGIPTTLPAAPTTWSIQTFTAASGSCSRQAVAGAWATRDTLGPESSGAPELVLSGISGMGADGGSIDGTKSGRNPMSGAPESTTGVKRPPDGSGAKTGENPPAGIGDEGAFKSGGSPDASDGDGDERTVGTGDEDETGSGVGSALSAGSLDGADTTLGAGVGTLEVGLLSGVGRRNGRFAMGVRIGAVTFSTVVVTGCVVFTTPDAVSDTVVVTALTTSVTDLAWVTDFTPVSTG